MLSDLKKSTNSTLYQRVTSPFFGTLIISWCIWNWRIIYLTVFVGRDELPINKIDFITNNYFEPDNLYWYPIISTVILLTVIPFIYNGAYWLYFRFKNWRISQKQSVEGKQLLTVEQSMQLRREMREQDIEFEKIIQKKDNEILFLKTQINQYQSEKETKPVSLAKSIINQPGYADYVSFKKNIKAFTHFSTIMKAVKNGIYPRNAPEEVIEYYMVNDLISYNK